MIDSRIGLPQLNWILSMYAVFLASGHTLVYRQIKSKTISLYIAAVATFLRMFDPEPHRDSRHAPYTHTCNHWLKKVYDQVSKFEKVPNRREAYTLAMQKELHNQTLELSKKKPDSKRVALFQWFGVALQGGNRRSEWCQLAQHKNIVSFELSPINQARAFTLGDVQFLTAHKQPIPMSTAIRQRHKVHHVILTYRWQKNMQHGEKKTYARNTKNRACDSVEHLLNICDRYIRLCGPSQTDRPLAVYRQSNGKIYHLTSVDVTIQMRALARTVYKITSKPALQLFTSHSLRVGACCILWAMGLSGEFIQRNLRWRSESWKDYIRDLTIQAHQHNSAMAECWDLPVY